MKDVFNPIIARLGMMPVLTVVGRRTGVPRSIPIGAPFEFRGTRYLVSGRGSTQWSRNLRAAGRGKLRIHGVTEEFRAVEITGAERDTIVAAYRESLGHAGDRYFSAIPNAADHPVFRLDPPSR